jgi:hypothetical protein
MKTPVSLDASSPAAARRSVAPGFGRWRRVPGPSPRNEAALLATIWPPHHGPNVSAPGPYCPHELEAAAGGPERPSGSTCWSVSSGRAAPRLQTWRAPGPRPRAVRAGARTGTARSSGRRRSSATATVRGPAAWRGSSWVSSWGRATGPGDEPGLEWLRGGRRIPGVSGPRRAPAAPCPCGRASPRSCGGPRWRSAPSAAPRRT